ncbi:alpha/beta hydrolase [Baekduia sp. Peel2402]|uniref:alpha/beta hydrolase n=1 Tax=Baekduia sp. Peel2402 TaxID=3458296 RepID=UPI00403EC774
MSRIDTEFDVAGETCAAWMYEPDRAVAAGPRPVVVLAHGLSGTRRDRLGPFAERFARSGCLALVFDHRGFGDSTGTPDRFVPARQLEDWAAAIACARAWPGADPDRVVTFGSSMGGGNALAAAAHDPRVAAAISQVPFLNMIRQAHRGSPRVAARMVLAALRDEHLPAVGAPGTAAFINAPGSEAGWRHVVATGEDSRWRDRVSARWLLGRPFNPGRHARDLHCPWLVCVGGADRVARPGAAIAAARRAPHGELRVYPGVDHFDIYDGPEHEAVVADQLAFLERHGLSGASGSVGCVSLPSGSPTARIPG